MSETTGEDEEAARDLDPEIRRFVATVAADLAAYPDLQTLPLPDVRRILEVVRARWTAGGPEMVETLELPVPARSGQVRLRIHKPVRGRRVPALVYLHGGGWTYFSLDTHDRLMREYAARAGVIVVGVDYALSPEARYPVALEQVVDTLRWLSVAGGEFDIDVRRLAVGGDSAGANLALAACLALRDAGERDIVHAMLLNYGAFDAEISAASPHPFGGPGYMLGAEEMQAYWRNYVRAEADLELPLVCPLRAELTGLPAALLVIPACDVLAEQGYALEHKLRHSGVPVRSLVYPGATHSFLEAVSIAAVSRRALSDSAAWLHEALQPGGDVPVA